MDDFYDFNKPENPVPAEEHTENKPADEVKPENEATPEEPKTEEPKTEEPKAEEPKPEEPKAEEPKAEEPKPDYTSGQWHGSPYDGTPERNFGYKDPTYGWNSSQYHGPEAPKPQKPKKKYGGIVAVISVFIILGMIASVAYGILGTGNGGSGNTGEKDSGSTSTIVQYQKPEGAEKITANEDGTYDPADLYTMTSKSVVGVLNYANGYTTAQGSGSGVIISADGYIVTNAHVVNGADAVSVVIYGENEELEAKIVGSDARSDIAVLKIERTGLTAVQFGTSAEVKVGEEVIAIGNPGGLKLSNSLTVGYISGVDREVTVDNYTMTYLQTDAAINPGNSGGALFNMYGQLVGINSAKISDTNYEGIGFAIPIDNAIPIIESIKANGYVKGRVRIGIAVQEISTIAARFNNVPEGLYVYSIDKDCDAYSKLQRGDIITEVNGKQVKATSELFAILDKCKIGETVNLKVYRTSRNLGGYHDISVKLSEDTGNTNFDEQ